MGWGVSRGGPQGLCGVGVSPLGNGTSPSSTTRVGIAPLPCSMDTTLSWEQFLPSRDGPGGPGQVSPVHGCPPDTPPPPPPPALAAEPTQQVPSTASPARSSPQEQLQGTEGLAPIPPIPPGQGSPYRARLSALCLAWGWGVFWWKDELMSWRGRENRFRSSPRMRGRPWGPTGQRRSGPGLGVPRGGSFGGQFSAKLCCPQQPLTSCPVR